MADVLLYASIDNGNGDLLRKLIDDRLQDVRLEVFRTVEGMNDRLRRIGDPVGIVVLVASSREDLWRILTMRDILIDLRIILLLPCMDDLVISAGHTLRPRFLTFIEREMEEVLDVLSKMLRIKDPR